MVRLRSGSTVSALCHALPVHGTEGQVGPAYATAGNNAKAAIENRSTRCSFARIARALLSVVYDRRGSIRTDGDEVCTVRDSVEHEGAVLAALGEERMIEHDHRAALLQAALFMHSARELDPTGSVRDAHRRGF